jgi:opacity protein-like surface antigen
MVAQRWSVKAEYLYVDLFSTDTGVVTPTAFAAAVPFAAASTFNHSYSENVVRVGFNYHFGPW